MIRCRKWTDIFMIPGKTIFKLAGELAHKQLLTKKTGAKIGRKSEWKKYISKSNAGFLINGSDLRLSEKMSYQNLCLIARPGFGKTTKYIIPNILDRSQYNNSIVVNDPSGEIYQQTSAFMNAQGFEVIVLDVSNPQHSHRFNPLLEISKVTDLEQIASLIIEAGGVSNDSSDPIWNNGATRLVTYLLKTLLNASRENEEYFSLANLYHLLQNFGETGEGLKDYITNYTINPHDINDTRLRDEWLGQITGSDKTIQSFLSTALTALSSMSNPDLQFISSKSTIELNQLRQKKTIIYFITPSQHANYYSFYTSLFFQALFNEAMSKIPDKNELPIYVLFDEFAHCCLPNFDSTVNTIRKHEVAITIVLQTINQLEEVYGSKTAKAILGGFSTYMTYAGSDIETCEFFQKIIGQVRETSKEKFTDLKSEVRDYNLFNTNDIRTLADNAALLVTSNNNPIILETIAHYQNKGLQRPIGMGAFPLSHLHTFSPVPLVPVR